MTLKEFLLKLRNILFDGEMEFSELLGVVNCFLCAFWMYLHPTLFAQGIVYRSIGILGDETVWGSIFFLFGSAKLFCIWIDRYRARKWVALASFFMWMFLLLTFYQNNPNALINVFIFEIMIVALIEYLRHREHALLRLESRKRLNLS